MKKISIYLELAMVYTVFLAIAVYTRGVGAANWIDKILSMATFVFAIILAFSTANRKQRLNSIRSLLRKNDALILTIYESSKSYGKKTTDTVRTLIDNMLVKQIDYKLIDFDRTTDELIALFRFCFEFKTPKNSESENKKVMMDGCRDLLTNQKEIIYWLKDGMKAFEWFSLTALGGIILYCLYSLNTGDMVYLIMLPLISISLALLLFVLRDLNSLVWQEERWIWGRLIDLFTELDLKPYFANVLFESNRINKKEINLPKEYRVAKYFHEYPNMDDKEVTVIKNPNSNLVKQ